jgi:hypothetical protein
MLHQELERRVYRQVSDHVVVIEDEHGFGGLGGHLVEQRCQQALEGGG